MKAAFKTAINNAVGILSKSFYSENGSRDEYVLDQAARAPLSVTGAQDTIKALEPTRATLETSMKARIIQARKRRNAFLPINRLPVEVVVEIFHIVLYSDALCPPKTTTHLARLKRLASVFSVWRSLVSGTPSLWAVLESTCPPAFLPTVIRKAKGSLLNIRCSWTDPRLVTRNKPTPHEKNVTAFLHAVLPLAQRWGTLYLDIPLSFDPPLEQVLETHMPNLRRASVSCIGYGPLVTNPFGGAAPQLKELSVHQVPIHWASVELKGLSVLVLIFCPVPSISHLFAILERSPGLEVLELNLVDPDITDAPSTIPSIVLPHLKDLSLRNINRQATSLLLQSIHTSRFETILIAPDPCDERTPFPDINSSLEHLLPAMKCAFNEAKTVDLTISGSEVNLTVNRGPDDPCVKLCARINRPPDLQNHLTWLQRNLDLKTLSASGINEASISLVELVNRVDLTRLPIFEWIPNITELSVLNSSGAPKLIHHLTERVRDGNKVGWRCPRLRKVAFCGFPTARRDVFEFARRRYGDRPKGDAVNQDAETTIHWPDKLELLDITGVSDMDYRTNKELKDIVGCELTVTVEDDYYYSPPGEEW